MNIEIDGLEGIRNISLNVSLYSYKAMLVEEIERRIFYLSRATEKADVSMVSAEDLEKEIRKISPIIEELRWVDDHLWLEDKI